MADGATTRKSILLAAERLFAERGIDAVAMREIGAAAGQRNNSAVQYHFGDKARLVRALYEYRLPPLNQRRLALLASVREAGRAGDLHALVDAYARPLAEAIGREDPSCYCRFVARFVADGLDLGDADLGDEAVGAFRTLSRWLERAIAAHPPVIRRERLRHMTLLVTSALADLERRTERGEPSPLAGEAFLANLVDGAVGLLQSPSRRPVGHDPAARGGRRGVLPD